MLAHQYLDQASSALRSSLSANASIKFAGGLSAHDAAAVAKDMRTTADVILDQPKLHFAAHIRGVTPTAVTIPLELIRSYPRLSPDDARELIERGRARVAKSREETREPMEEDEEVADWEEIDEDDGEF